MNTKLTRRSLLSLSVAALTTALAFPTLNVQPAFAHEAPCPYCQMTVNDATAAVLRAGRKRVEYKCVYCALAEAKTEYQGDVAVSAPSEKAGKRVVLKRTGGKWTALPATAYFVAPQHIKHKVCQAQARAFTTRAAAQSFAKKNGGMVMTLAQINAMAD